MEFFKQILVFLGLGFGLLMIPFGLPGTAVILGSSLLFAVSTGFQAGVTVNLLILMSILTVVAETADNWLMALGARKFGASRGSIWMSFLGAFLGAVLLGPLLVWFLGLLSPFFGAFLGAFLSVVLYEYFKTRKNPGLAVRAGWGAILGRFLGLLLKMMIGLGMAVTVAYRILSSGAHT
jgi:uncharacterized protein YqgC (DUF456 family)